MAERNVTDIDCPRWLGWGAAGGIGAGAAFLAVTMWFATSVGGPAKGPLLGTCEDHCQVTVRAADVIRVRLLPF